MSYKIVIKNNSFISEIEMIKPKLIIADNNVTVPSVNYPIEYLVVNEANKDFEFYFKILELFNDYRLNRNDTVVIVGGGVLIDVASFAASTFKRGINYVNVPTTTLSMIDSSVGSKNGLNHLGTKNLIGNISDPSKVIIDPTFLSTLDQRNYNNGIAEAIKIGYLSNQEIINQLNKPRVEIETVIRLSIDEKLNYVQRDKNDLGYRNYLNFGHTFGHAIESVTNFETFYHGEAVSIGMVIASGYDLQLVALLNKFELPTELPSTINVDELIEVMHGDKKNTSDKIKIVLKNPDKQIVELTNSQVKSLFDLTIKIPNQLPVNNVTVNRSKSHIHRLLATALATKSKISFKFDQVNDLSDDVIQSIKVITNSGGLVNINSGVLNCDCSNITKPTTSYYIYKSATTYRIFAPILCSLFGTVEIELDQQLASRPHTPLTPYIDGIKHSIPFKSGNYIVDGALSSQFVSGYILAAIASNRNTNITIAGDITSTPYIDMTINVANLFGAKVSRVGNQISVNTHQTSSDLVLEPEPDFSSLAYFVVFNKLAKINNLTKTIGFESYERQSLQADSIIFEILDQEVIDMKNCPDLLPTLVVYGLLNKRGLTLTNIDRIKFKECDRIEAMIENYADLNAIKRSADSLVICPVASIPGRTIKTFGDHRIAMAASIIAPFCDGPITIDDRTVVNKSFPTFFKQLLGVEYERIK